MTDQDSIPGETPLVGSDAGDARPGRGPGRSAWVAGALLAVMTIVAYLPATQCGFVWDDDSYVLDNQTLRSPDGLRQIWLDIGATAQYYPMVYTTYWIEYRLWELDPTGYHVVNILLHALVAILLWRVLTLLNVPGAWVAAAVFALHPVHVQSAAWITQRKNVLSFVLYLGAALTYLRYALPPADEAGYRRSPWLYIVALLLFLGALLSKTVTCTLPMVLLLVLWWKRDRITSADIRALVPVFVLGIAFGLLTIQVESHEVRAMGEEWDRSFIDRFLVAGQTVWFYLHKLIWPRQLSFVYTRWQVDAQAWQQYIYPLAAIAVAAAVWIARGRIGKGPVAAVLCFGVTLFPAMGFFNIYFTRYSYVADQWQYVASTFAIGLVVGMGYRAADRVGSAARRGVAVLAGVILLALGALTWRYESVFTDLETIWLDTLEKNPDCWLAHNNLGNVYLSQEKTDEAIRHYREALQVEPRFEANITRTHYNLGNALASQGKFEQAITQFRRVLEVRPNDPGIHRRLALALRKTGRLDQAINHLREVVRLNPGRLAPLTGLAWILTADTDASIRKPDEAVRLAERAAELTKGRNGAVLDLLAAAYAADEQFDQAIATAERALQLAEAAQEDRLTNAIRIRLELYRQGKPFRRSGSTQDTGGS